MKTLYRIKTFRRPDGSFYHCVQEKVRWFGRWRTWTDQGYLPLQFDTFERAAKAAYNDSQDFSDEN